MKKKVIIPVIASLVTVIVLSGVSYAYFSAKIKENNKTETVLKSNELNLIFTGTNEITANNMIPGDSFTKTFTVENTSNRAVDYNIYMENITNEFNEDLVYTLEDTTGSVIGETPLPVTNKDKSYLKTGISIEANTIKTYTLKITFKNTDEPQNDYQGKTFKGTLGIDTKKINKEYKETLLNGTDPVLSDNLVPVTIADDGTVTKADINTEWYKYEDKKWANAVILSDNTQTYNNGDIIPEDNIESYFVWIPRYRYQIFNEGNYKELSNKDNKIQTINIEFENKNTLPSNGKIKDSWLTNPAFTSFNSNGFWVGKFETGYAGATTTLEAQVNSVNTNKIIIKPNTYSWRNITVANMFKNSYDYNRNLDSHMMKNTEWGAVALLQHSKYGSQTSVRVNNNGNYITGYAATIEPTLGYNNETSIEGNRVEATLPEKDGSYTENYLNPNSTVASTTGNKSGIYDMAGGAWEDVAGYTVNASNLGGASEITNIYHNFFADDTYAKYYDKYTSTFETQYNLRILGDATGEMGPFGIEGDPDGIKRLKSSWYGDYASFVFANSPWFVRGGHWYGGSVSGIFTFAAWTGASFNESTFRIVLTPI